MTREVITVQEQNGTRRIMAKKWELSMYPCENGYKVVFVDVCNYTTKFLGDIYIGFGMEDPNYEDLCSEVNEEIKEEICLTLEMVYLSMMRDRLNGKAIGTSFVNEKIRREKTCLALEREMINEKMLGSSFADESVYAIFEENGTRRIITEKWEIFLYPYKNENEYKVMLVNLHNYNPRFLGVYDATDDDIDYEDLCSAVEAEIKSEVQRQLYRYQRYYLIGYIKNCLSNKNVRQVVQIN